MAGEYSEVWWQINESYARETSWFHFGAVAPDVQPRDPSDPHATRRRHRDARQPPRTRERIYCTFLGLLNGHGHRHARFEELVVGEVAADHCSVTSMTQMSPSPTSQVK